jgi:crotonobetainyl-CoA:carnitine CoA-transferase CaiB-like acyl-CoA transferase
MATALKDLRVLELASVLAGPGVGQFFAELGATVIKVENARSDGDVTRSWRVSGETTDDRSAYFCSVNWGKQSIAVDLGAPEGRDIVYRLSLQCDIVIASYKPGDAEKLGVDYKSLAREHPELIYGLITGYGSRDTRVGYDAIIQAESGFMFLNGEPGGRSMKMPVALVDILAGHHLKEGLLLAFLEKYKTGRGSLVEVSLMDAALASLANQATNYLVAGQTPSKHGSAHPNIAPYGDVFLTSDGKEVLLAVGNDRQFADLCAILQIGEIVKDLPFQDNVSRVRNRADLNKFLSDAISKVTAPSLIAALHEARIPGGLIRSIPEIMSESAARDMMLSADSLCSLRTFIARPASSVSHHILPPPHFGEHTRVLLTEMLNFSPTAAGDLLARGIVR